jgi:hypothetical protein
VKYWFGLLLFSIAAPVAAAPKADDIAAYKALGALDLRLATIGYRLVTANAPFCTMTRPDPGWVLHDIAQYPDEEVARAAFAFSGPVAIAALVPNGAAERAGLQAGDGIMGIDSRTWEFDGSKLRKPDYRRMELVKSLFDDAIANSKHLVVRYERGGRKDQLLLEPVTACRSDFTVDPAAGRDAGADGDRVRVTSGMIDYTADDNELAAVVAHELSHNLLDHRATCCRRSALSARCAIAAKPRWVLPRRARSQPSGLRKATSSSVGLCSLRSIPPASGPT